ncbi:hypothetical protein [[Clostridium] aminophilum]|uniref:hypothetical protein n=1 Tax=[Clostridium] aminophilum TaxID=1526 RepID=UPI00332E7BC5
MKKTRVLAVLMSAALSMATALPAYAGTWKQDAVGRWYEHDDGSYCQNGWDYIGDAYYYFDENGYLMTNSTTPDGYKVDATGKWIEHTTNNVSQSGIRSEILDAKLDEPIIQIDNLLIRYDASQSVSDFVNYVEQQGYTVEWDSNQLMNPRDSNEVKVYKNGQLYFKMRYENCSGKITRANDDNVVIEGFISDYISHDASRNTWLPTGINLNGDGLYYDESLFDEYRGGYKDEVLTDQNLIRKTLWVKYDTAIGTPGYRSNFIHLFFDANTLECKRVWYVEKNYIPFWSFHTKTWLDNIVNMMGPQSLPNR